MKFVLQDYASLDDEQPVKTPVMVATDSGDPVGSLVSSASLDWYQVRNFPEVGLEQFRSALLSGEPWSIWLQLIYFSGDQDEVRLARSPHHMEELGDYGTLTVSQFSQILEDFHQFVEDRIEFEREY